MRPSLVRKVLVIALVATLPLLAYLAHVLPRTLEYKWYEHETMVDVIVRAAREGDATYLRTLSYFVDLDMLHPTEDVTALAKCARWSNEAAVRLLLSLGCDPNGRSGQAHSPLEDAWGVAGRLLVDAGAACTFSQAIRVEHLAEIRRQMDESPNRLTDYVFTRKGQVSPVHAAIDWYCYDSAKLLLELGADPNQRSVYGTTPLHEAVEEEDRFIFLLLEYGADPNAKAPDGLTALEIAEASEWRNACTPAIERLREITTIQDYREHSRVDATVDPPAEDPAASSDL